jgi:hypothetical protein
LCLSKRQVEIGLGLVDAALSDVRDAEQDAPIDRSKH